jgi:hypothetical protein
MTDMTHLFDASRLTDGAIAAPSPSPADLAPALDPEADAPPAPQLAIEPWPDPVIDRLGHDPRSAYVERFWLSILGPSTVVLLRRLAVELDEHPEGVSLDLTETAASIGVGMKGGRQSAFMRTVDRVCRFGGARWQGPGQLGVRRKLPPLTRGQLVRLSPGLQQQHEAWVGLDNQVVRNDDVVPMRERARGLALSLLELGEDPSSAEQQLHRWRFHPAVAHEAMRWAIDHQRTMAGSVGGPPLDAA